MKYRFLPLILAFISVGTSAQQLDSLVTYAPEKGTDFSNPAGIFTQATFNGGIDVILSGPGNGFNMRFNDASWFQNIGTEVAIGNVGIGTSFGYSNLAYEVLLRPTAHISYRQPLKLGDFKALKMTVAGGIPLTNFDDYNDQVLPFYTHNALHFMFEVMGDVQLSRKWRITPYMAFNQYKTMESKTLYLVIDSNGNVYEDTTRLKPISAQRNFTLGFNVVQSYSNTHFLQFHASGTFRNHINLTNYGWQQLGDPDLSPLFHAGVTYHTAIWRTLMFNANLGFTSVDKFSLNNYTNSMGWNMHIAVGLRYGL